MGFRLMWVSALAVAAGIGGASAQSCGGTYKVKPGDSLSRIADREYKDAKKWSLVYSTNRQQIGDSPNSIRVGQSLSLPCVNGLPTGLPGGTVVAAPKPAAPATTQAQAQVTLASAQADISSIGTVSLLTGDDYAPFTDRSALNEGLVTEIVKTAMGAAPVDGYKIHWVNDWSSHLEPLLSNAMLDLGFPWMQPDCKSTPSEYRCENFHFSDPMFEMLVLLFTDSSRPIAFDTDDDIVGKTLCRPAGYFTHDLNKDGRNWLANNLITLEQPRTVAECFEMLSEGSVDAVAMNEFTGRATVKSLGLDAQVDTVPRPLSIEGLHVVVHKSHPKGEALIDSVNAGLDEIKQNGAYQNVVDTHMSAIWGSL